VILQQRFDRAVDREGFGVSWGDWIVHLRAPFEHLAGLAQARPTGAGSVMLRPLMVEARFV
jgi:hypothetical protein